MPHIQVIDENQAEGDLFKLYDSIQKTRGRVSNVLRIQSLHHQALKNHLDMYMTIMYGKSPLNRHDRELIATVVSSANGCLYCFTHHGEALNKYAKDNAFVAQVIDDFRQAKLTAEQMALAEYAEGLTLRPAAGRKEAVAALRNAGFSDEQILHATEVTAYFNFVNRLVHGLGVELEGDSEREYDY